MSLKIKHIKLFGKSQFNQKSEETEKCNEASWVSTHTW